MPKRKKYPRLPNAFGSIRYLGKNRTNCYAVHPPAKDCDEMGNYIRPKALCYVDDWYVGFAVLNAYRAGTYKPGDEVLFKSYRSVSGTDLDAFCNRLLTDFSAHAYIKTQENENAPTFAEVYEQFYEWKYGENAKKKLSEASRSSTRAAFKQCAAIHDQPFQALRYQELQDVVDHCPKKSATKENIVNLMKQMYAYADLQELCDKNWAEHVSVGNAADDEHGVPFSDQELKILWANKKNETVEMLIIMCYSGYRIAAYKDLEVNTDEWFFKGGVKTSAGKNRIVPIHTAIRPLVASRIKRSGTLLAVSPHTFRNQMYDVLASLRIEKHTPHDCRHTFSRLCEKYGVSDADRKRMMGHSFGKDITNGVYGHRTLEDLRSELEKVKADL